MSLVTALFSAVDQMMVSHDSIDYDVEWPQDYAYMLNGACLTSAPRERIHGSALVPTTVPITTSPVTTMPAVALPTARVASFPSDSHRPALTFRALALFADRKSVRRTETFSGGRLPDEARTVQSRSCFPFF